MDDPFPDIVIAIAPPGFEWATSVFQRCRDTRAPLYRRLDKGGRRICYMSPEEMRGMGLVERWVSPIEWMMETRVDGTDASVQVERLLTMVETRTEDRR